MDFLVSDINEITNPDVLKGFCIDLKVYLEMYEKFKKAKF
jgi:hypothetical protein